MNWLICRHCMMVVPADDPQCKCIPHPHLPRTQCLMNLQLPEGYELVRRVDEIAERTELEVAP